jgi:hypothetical protein
VRRRRRIYILGSNICKKNLNEIKFLLQVICLLAYCGYRKRRNGGYKSPPQQQPFMTQSQQQQYTAFSAGMCWRLFVLMFHRFYLEVYDYGRQFKYI